MLYKSQSPATVENTSQKIQALISLFNRKPWLLILKLVCTVTVLCMLEVDSMPMATAALTCGYVRIQLFPCLSYVTSSGENVQGPPEGWCDGFRIRSLKELAQNKADRQTDFRTHWDFSRSQLILFYSLIYHAFLFVLIYT